MSVCDSESYSISSVLSDTNLDEMMGTFDDLIQSSERLLESINKSSDNLNNIYKQIEFQNTISVTHNGWSGDFEELLKILHLKASENHNIHFGDLLLDVLKTGTFCE